MLRIIKRACPLGREGAGSMNILMAEDDRVSRMFLDALLVRLGHTVTACEDGRQAWETYKRGHYLVVLSDWMMPEMSGLDLCRAIRRLNRRPRCYFVLLSAKSTDQDARAALAAGADGYIVKPIHREELESRLTLFSKTLGEAMG
jgi:two-component system cell cycle response regulator